MKKIEKVREVGFDLASAWFINEASASTFVLNHQEEVMNMTPMPPPFHKEEIVKAWEFIKNQYLEIPVDCVKPWDLVNSLKDYQSPWR
ncbi:MAG: hypothetical protein ACKPE3_12565 [Sphaerospermopsis kisseleviana]